MEMRISLIQLLQKESAQKVFFEYTGAQQDKRVFAHCL